MARGYQNYRGRRAGSTKLIVAALTLILLAACTFLVIQRYVSYTDDGQLHFNLPPFFQKDEETNQPEENKDTQNQPDSQDVNLVISSPDDTDTPAEPPSEPETEPTTPEPVRLLAFESLPADSAALTESINTTGANGFLYPIRDNTGKVFYASPTAADKASAGDETTNEAISRFCAGTTNAVARFNCFHDSYYAFIHMKEAAICQKTTYVWYDNHSYHWLDPSKEQARNYVIGLAVECASLGFNELLLDELCYPTSGKLEKIDYSGNTMGKTEALVLFLTELRAALEPFGTKLSLLLTEELIQSGSNAESGQDLTALLPLVDAVYAKVSDAAAAQELLRGYVGEAEPPMLIPLVQEPQEGSWCLSAS